LPAPVRVTAGGLVGSCATLTAIRQYRPPAFTGRSGLQNRLAVNTVAGGLTPLPLRQD